MEKLKYYQTNEPEQYHYAKYLQYENETDCKGKEDINSLLISK